ncbi:MAG: YfiR family protein [Candidatus Latescibacterota bacterium]|nr:MAG: YfiR family protein [Candidatus Latescibacterota bacterium]
MTRIPHNSTALCLAMAILLSPIVSAGAQDVLVPIEVQFPLFVKILSFDRNLQRNAGGEIVIAIVYQGGYIPSLNARDAIKDVFEKSGDIGVGNNAMRHVCVDIETEELTHVVAKHNVDILYITPLKAVDIESITKTSRALALITLTGVPDYVRSGVSVGIGLKEEKPEIIINLAAAKAEGADFSSRLLRLARIVD